MSVIVLIVVVPIVTVVEVVVTTPLCLRDYYNSIALWIVTLTYN